MNELKFPLFLIGLPGVGKTTTGQLLSAKLHVPFVDLDDLIVQREGKAIKVVFKEKGEEYFRMVEKECLHALLQKNEPSVVAVGGGTPCFFDNLERMKNEGKTCYLQVSWEILALRAVVDNTRPLFADLEQANLALSLAETFSWRLPIYRQADIVIDTDHRDAVEITNELIAKLAQKSQQS